MLVDLDALLLPLVDVADGDGWVNWLDLLAAAFGTSDAALVPLPSGAPPAARPGERRRASFPELPTWIASLKAAGPRPVRLPPTAERDATGLGVVLDAGVERYGLVLRRDAAAGAFSAVEADEFGRIAAYVERILRRERTVAAAQAEARAFRQVLNRSRRGFILLDRTLSLLFANSHATAAFAAGGSIRLRSRRPTPRNRADARRFREALEFALGFPERQSVVTLRGLEDEVDLVATVGGLACPKAPIDLGARPAAVVVRLSSALPRTTLLAPGYLEAIFTFTPKEAQVANLLVAGLELPEISTRLAIAYGTTRQHLKAIFVKTGLHRQRDLVHLLRMSLPPDSGVTSAA